MSVTETILETIFGVAGKVFGSANERELKRLWPQVEKVNEAWETIRTLDDDALRAKTAEFRRRLLRGETEEDVLPEAFAVCREAAHRTLGQKKMVDAPYDSLFLENGNFVYKPVGKQIPLFAHFDVQILGGLVLHQGRIAEMVTGEGKTLVATLPTYLNALRPTDEWAAKARELQGEDMASWTFKPYGLYRHETGDEEWRLLDRLVPEEGDFTWEAPAKIIPLSRGVHVVTTNDYLAARDADYNRPLFDFLGLQIHAIQSSMDSRERYPVYMGDIVYGMNSEFGFDYLRDNLKVRPEDQVQRSRFFAIVDEVDNILIDEARTPLIISGSTKQTSEKYHLADKVARKLKGGDQIKLDEVIAKLIREGYSKEDARMAAEEDYDFVFSERDHTAKLTERGMHHALRVLGMDDIYSGENLDMPHYIDNALRAHALYKKEHHYIVKEGGVYIVDEFTGRVLEGRRWSDGLHQAVEAKEGLRIKEESQTVATITYQNFYRLYDRLAGMTGTAMTEAKEFHHTYKLDVMSIPTNRPLRRVNYPDLIYGTGKEKYEALVDEVAEIHATGRPILIGTVSIERSEIVSALLKRRGIKHEVLNAKHHAREAQIVALAGQMGAVTVATNMAGRGTDIVLGHCTPEELLEHWQARGIAPKKNISADMTADQIREVCRPLWIKRYLTDVKADVGEKTPEEWDKLLSKRWHEYGMEGPLWVDRVAAMGGLHIVGTERHEARRIDNQLRGRAGRQGDPGSSRFYLSLEDDTMRLFAPERVANIMRSMGLSEGVPIESRLVTRTVENAQRKVEERNFEIRKNLLEYDQVMNEQRLVVYAKRQAWLEDRELRESMLEFCESDVEGHVQEATAGPREEWDLPGLARFMEDSFHVAVDAAELEALQNAPDPAAAIGESLMKRLHDAYEKREAEIGADNLRTLEKLVLLETIDRKWMDHLYAMDLLKEGIHLWGYAQQDPKVRYKREGFELFEEMWLGYQQEVAELILRLKPVEAMEVEQQVDIEAEVHQDFDAYADQADAVGADAGGPQHEPIKNMAPKVGRNDPCPCGSGLKYKKCCAHKGSGSAA